MTRAADIICNGGKLTEALLAAGYKESTALQGVRSVPDALWDKLHERGKDYARLGAKLNPELVAQTIKGRLYNNVITGEYKGETAAKLLGSMRDYNLFTPDSQVGVIVLQSPNMLPAGKPIELPDPKDFEE